MKIFIVKALEAISYLGSFGFIVAGAVGTYFVECPLWRWVQPVDATLYFILSAGAPTLRLSPSRQRVLGRH
jgi:hypothetical protein